MTRRWSARRAIVQGLALCWVASPTGAAELTPAADGSLGALLLATPLRGADVPPEALVPKRNGRVQGVRFKPMIFASALLNLSSRVPKKGVAVVGGALTMPAASRALFLISTTGTGALYVDSKKVGDLFSAGRGAAWQPVPINLERGTRPFALLLRRERGPLTLRIRVLSAVDQRPLAGVRLLLPDVPPTALSSGWLTASIDSGLSEGGYFPKLELRALGGAPPGRVPVRVAVGSSAAIALGSMVGSRGVLPFEAHLPPPAVGQAKETYRIFAGDVERRLELRMPLQGPKLLGRAVAGLAKLTGSAGKSFKHAEVLRASIATKVRDLKEASSPQGIGVATAALAAFLKPIEAGRDPLKLVGVHELARPSTVSSQPDRMRLHVPATRGEKRLPLVVLLHGMNGTPKGIMDAFLDESSRRAVVPGYVLAPHAHGNAFYRGPGEREVMDAVAWALETLPVDPARVSITGVSMGGTGTAHVALRYPEKFSAAAPLCGYHSYFVRRDTDNRPLRDWERSRMRHWSPAEWAGNGWATPWWIAHGKKDFPLENSRVLIAALKDQSAALTQEWPDTGHAVWEKTYAGARLFPWLAGKTARRLPKRVVIMTDSYRYAKRQWLAITRLGRPGTMATVDATLEPDALRIQTKNVNGLAVDRKQLPQAAPRSVRIDGQSLAWREGTLELTHSTSGSWSLGANHPGPGEKRLGAEGPIRDVFNGPVVFSYGTRDRASGRAAKEVAEAWAARFGAEAKYAVVPDFALVADRVRDVHLVLVGTPDSHAWLRRHGSSLPVRTEMGALKIGTRDFPGPGVGAVFIAQSPFRRDRSWLVITARDAAGLYLSRSLPALLPDYIVFDERVAAAAGEQVLGETPVLAAGFWDHDFRPLQPRAGAGAQDGGP